MGALCEVGDPPEVGLTSFELSEALVSWSPHEKPGPICSQSLTQADTWLPELNQHLKAPAE